MQRCSCGLIAKRIPCSDCRARAQADYSRWRGQADRFGRKRGPSAQTRPGWHNKRAQARERAGHKCQHCGTPHNLEVHHIIPIATELEQYGAPDVRALLARGVDPDRAENLAVVCRSCHDLIHHGH